MRILITGASGQIGTNLGLHCLALGHEVIGLDRRPNPWTRAFPTVLVDLCAHSEEAPAMPASGRAPDVLVHLAAHAKVHELVGRPALAISNIRMTATALEWCRRWRVPIVLASSREVYGDALVSPTPESAVAHERSASPYAAGKLAAESLAHSYARCYGLPVLILRLSNVYGRYDIDLRRLERVVPLYIDRIARDLPVTVYGAEKTLDFTHVDDCVTGIRAGIERLVAGALRQRTINLATGCGHSLPDLAGFIGATLDRQPRIEWRDARPGEITRYVADLSVARSLLGYAPTVSLPTGVAMAVSWGREWRVAQQARGADRSARTGNA